MLEFDARRADNGSSAAPPTATADAQPASARRQGGRRALSAAALDVSAEPTVPAYSPIVLAGTVRLIEFALTVLVGSAIYVAYVVPIEGFEWHYVAAILTIAVLVDAGAADRRRLSGAGVPRLREAIFPARLGLVGGLPDRHRRDASSPRSATTSRACGSAASTSLGLPPCSPSGARCSCWCGSWTRQGRLDRRTVVVGADERGEA